MNSHLALLLEQTQPGRPGQATWDLVMIQSEGANCGHTSLAHETFSWSWAPSAAKKPDTVTKDNVNTGL